MKKNLLYLLLLLPFTTSAQNWLGLSNSNYGGTNSLYLNPSNVVDSRYRVYVNLAGLGINLHNNYLRLDAPHSLPYYMKNSDAKFEDSYVKENLNGKPKFFSFNTELRGPSVLFNLSSKHAIAVSTRVRMFAQAIDVAEPFARMMAWGLSPNSNAFSGGSPLVYDNVYSDNSFNINLNAYSELSATYGVVLLDKKQHFLKAGITPKFLSGLYTMYVKNSGGAVQPLGQDSIRFRNFNLSYGYINEAYYFDIATQIIGNDTSTQVKNRNLNFGSLFGNSVGHGFGLDLGFSYEYRPNYLDYKMTMDGEDRWDRTSNKYLFRVSAALMDVGAIRYNSSNYVRSFALDLKDSAAWYNMDTVANSFKDVQNSESQSVLHRFDDAVQQVFGFKNIGNQIVTKLPTAFNFQLDAKLFWHFYANVTWLQGLRKKGDIGMRQFSFLALTPRFESKWFDLAVPLVLNNDYKDFTMGFYVKAGPIYVGSDNLIGAIKTKNVNGMDLYFGAAIPIFKRNPRDRDGDHVSDKRDKCRNTPGSWEFQGCPDRDGDHVEDAKDQCPDQPGPAKFNGCPDRDGDDVQDVNDSCPDVKGLSIFNGCPDTDEDGVEDKKDSCLYVKGPAESNGCPDTDEDGIIDKDDDCVNVKGPKELGGCPDKDGDGVRDIEDRCPDKPGLPKFKGCPDTDGDDIPDYMDKCPEETGLAEYGGCPDTDGDKLPDNIDLCPMEPGLPENNGCPKVSEQLELIELEEEEEKVLREAFENLEFETGKAVISKESYPSLDELAQLLNLRLTYRLYISGHTDNVGDKKSNQKLSENRAKAVKDYLVSKGVEPERIKSEGFGDSRPAASNATAAGRQKNRRVEFKVVK